MANTKISALPLYTGNTDGGYLVFNNSGETTTYKIVKSELFNLPGTIQTNQGYTASGSAANIGIALTPKGTGAFSLSQPTNTAVGGNSRGAYAVDLLLERQLATDVASGTGAFIGGGRFGKANGTYSAVAAGTANIASGQNCLVAGYDCQVTNAYDFAFGRQSVASGGYSFAGGNLATASGSNSFAIGDGAQATSTLGFASGSFVKAELVGQFARTHNGFGGVYGSGQQSQITMSRSSGLTSSDVMLLRNTSTDGIALPGNNRVWSVWMNWTAVVTAIGTGATLSVGDMYGAVSYFNVSKVGGTLSIGNTNIISSGYTGNMTDCSLTAYDTFADNKLQLEFLPPSLATDNNTYRVFATLFITEISW